MLKLQNMQKGATCDCGSREEEDGNFDIYLLRFLSVFLYVHLGFQFFSGVTHVSMGDSSFFPGWLAILSAILNMGEVAALMIFLIELKGKVCLIYGNILSQSDIISYYLRSTEA